MIEHYVDFDQSGPAPLADLVTCATPGCNTRTLPRIAAEHWPLDVCDFCQDPELRAVVYAPIASDAQRQLEDQGQKQKRRQEWEARQPAEPAPPDPNQASFWSEDPTLRRKAA